MVKVTSCGEIRFLRSVYLQAQHIASACSRIWLQQERHRHRSCCTKCTWRNKFLFMVPPSQSKVSSQQTRTVLPDLVWTARPTRCGGFQDLVTNPTIRNYGNGQQRYLYTVRHE